MMMFKVLAVFIVLLGSMGTAYQVYKMTILDAKCRGFKHPKLWGLFSIGGQNSSGLILYLVGRRKYPITMSIEERAEMESRKKRTAVCLVFLVTGTLTLILSMVFV